MCVKRRATRALLFNWCLFLLALFFPSAKVNRSIFAFYFSLNVCFYFLARFCVVADFHEWNFWVAFGSEVFKMLWKWGEPELKSLLHDDTHSWAHWSRLHQWNAELTNWSNYSNLWASKWSEISTFDVLVFGFCVSMTAKPFAMVILWWRAWVKPKTSLRYDWNQFRLHNSRSQYWWPEPLIILHLMKSSLVSPPNTRPIS